MKKRIAYVIVPGYGGDDNRENEIKLGEVRISVYDGVLTVFDGPGADADVQTYYADGAWRRAGYRRVEG